VELEDEVRRWLATSARRQLEHMRHGEQHLGALECERLRDTSWVHGFARLLAPSLRPGLRPSTDCLP
jgi:hypothetical protein